LPSEGASRFKLAVQVINSVTSTKLPLLLQQVASKTAQASDPDGDGDVGKLFTAAQEAELQSMLALSAEELTTLLRAASYIFEIAGFESVKPVVLQEELIASGVDEDKAAAFRDAWASEGGAVVASMRARTLGGPAELVGSAFQIHQSVGNSLVSLARDSTAILELHLVGKASRPGMDAEAAEKDATAASAAAAAQKALEKPSGLLDSAEEECVGVSGVGDTRLRLELDRAGLLDLLEHLDGIQEALDRLSES
jgi:hypothetical protein